MTMRRTYDRVRVTGNHWGATVTCSCGATAELATASPGGSHMPPEAISKIFRRRGWTIGAIAKKDRCPDCSGRKHHHEETEDVKPSQRLDAMKEPTPPKPGASEEPPRVMGREDRQIVFAKLSEVYLGEKVGYADDWHDERVARDLNCPRAWVVEVREQFFGPIKASQSPEVMGLFDKVAELEAELTRLALEAAPMAKKARSIVEDLDKLSDALSGMNKRITAHNDELATWRESQRTVGAGLTNLRTELRKITGGRA